MKFVSLIVFVIFALSPAMAQDTAPAIGSAATDQSQPDDTTVIADTKRILIIGDAMGGGMGAGLARAIGDDPQYEVVNRFNEASALSRPDRYDWAASIPKIMDGKDFSVAVVLIGLNDRQDIRTDTARYAFNTPEWISNMTISGTNIYKQLGFNVTLKYQTNYYWQSFLINGNVPAVFNADCMLHYSFAKNLIDMKIGSANILNHYYYSILGGPQIGGLYYTTLTYSLK